MTAGNKIGLAIMLVVLYTMLTHVIPDGIEAWKEALLAIAFNVGLLIWLLSDSRSS